MLVHGNPTGIRPRACSVLLNSSLSNRLYRSGPDADQLQEIIRDCARRRHRDRHVVGRYSIGGYLAGSEPILGRIRARRGLRRRRMVRQVTGSGEHCCVGRLLQYSPVEIPRFHPDLAAENDRRSGGDKGDAARVRSRPHGRGARTTPRALAILFGAIFHLWRRERRAECFGLIEDCEKLIAENE